MGQKTHPTGFRLGVIKTWQGRWCAPRVKLYTQQLHEDLAVRSAIMERLPDAGISRVEIERGANQLTATIYTARPGIVIGRGGQRVDELRLAMEELTGKRGPHQYSRNPGARLGSQPGGPQHCRAA